MRSAAKFIITILAICFALSSTAQNIKRASRYSREISMTIENDIFFFIDYYYTAGQDFHYKRLASPHSALQRIFVDSNNDSAKVIIDYGAGIKIFTPKVLDVSSTKFMDRPYAGWSYARVGVFGFPKANVANHFEVEAGLVGKVSGMEKLQKWVHKVTDFESPKGWNSQIRDEFVINLYYNRLYEYQLLDNLGLVSQSGVQAGTGGNKISQDVTVRAFKFNKISNSAFTQSRLSWDTRAEGKKKKNEVFVFASAGIDYVASNVFIEGSLFSDHKSVFTVQRQPWILRRAFGFMFASRNISWTVTAIHLSKEVKKGTGHDYGSLGMAVRF